MKNPIIFKKVKCRKALTKKIEIYLPKAIPNLPNFFYADLTFKNIKEREKNK